MADRKKKFFCCSSWRLCFHVVDIIWLSLILLFQGTVMNAYIINHYNDSNTPYFFFVADFLCLATFIGTLATSYNYLRKVSAVEELAISRMRGNPQEISHFGLLPLSYVSWLFYVAVLVTKIVVIFSRQPLLRSLVPKDFFGPQLLKVTMSLAGIVFLLLLEGHNWTKRGTPRYSYVTSVCAKTGIELFDSVALLSILIDDHPSDLGGMQDVILGVAAFNFFLPALKLYQLSFPDKTIDRRSLLVAVSYYILHLILVDIPFLAIRLYLWFAFGENASMFLMKNILSIILTLRGMYPDLISLYKVYFTKHEETNRRSSHKKPEVGKFEEVPLADHQKGEPV